MLRWILGFVTKKEERICRNCGKPIEHKLTSLHEWRHKDGKWLTCFDKDGEPMFLTAEPIEDSYEHSK